MERSASFVQVAQEDMTLSEILCQLEGPGSSDSSTVRVDRVLIRRERQTFRRLPKSGALVFTVKTTLTPLQDLDEEELLGLKREMESWPTEVATYKGRHVWGECAMRYCESKISDAVEGHTV